MPPYALVPSQIPQCANCYKPIWLSVYFGMGSSEEGELFLNSLESSDSWDGWKAGGARMLIWRWRGLRVCIPHRRGTPDKLEQWAQTKVEKSVYQVPGPRSCLLITLESKESRSKCHFENENNTHRCSCASSSSFSRLTGNTCLCCPKSSH